jgi:hypothetical protein
VSVKERRKERKKKRRKRKEKRGREGITDLQPRHLDWCQPFTQRWGIMLGIYA